MFNVTIEDKRKFIDWFLYYYPLADAKVRDLLLYLRNNLLDRVHFIDDVRYIPRGFLFSSKESKMPTFKFYRKGVANTSNVDTALKYIHLNPEAEFYVRIYFRDSNKSPEYMGVCINNAFVDEHENDVHDDLYATLFLATSIKIANINRLRQMIDEAIDNGDEKAFMKLSAELQQLEEQDVNMCDSNYS